MGRSLGGISPEGDIALAPRMSVGIARPLPVESRRGGVARKIVDVAPTGLEFCDANVPTLTRGARTMSPLKRGSEEPLNSLARESGPAATKG